MVFLYIFLALLLLISVLLLLSVRLTFSYSDSAEVKIGVLFFNYNLTSERSNPKKSKPKKVKIKQQGYSGQEKTSKKSIISEFTEDMSVSDFINLLRRFLIRLEAVFEKHLRVRLRSFIIDVSAETPDKAAMLFGGISGAVSVLFEFLSARTKLYPIEKSKVAVRCDFDAKNTTADINIILKLRVIFIVGYLIGAFFDFINFRENKLNKTSLKGTIKNERN